MKEGGQRPAVPTVRALLLPQQLGHSCGINRTAGDGGPNSRDNYRSYGSAVVGCVDTTLEEVQFPFLCAAGGKGRGSVRAEGTGRLWCRRQA